MASRIGSQKVVHARDTGAICCCPYKDNVATFFSAPVPLMQTGLLRFPHIPDPTQFGDVAAMTPAELEEFCLRLLLVAHPTCLMLTLGGWEIVALRVMQQVSKQGVGSMAVLDMPTQEITVAGNTLDCNGWTIKADGIIIAFDIRPDPSLAVGPLPFTGYDALTASYVLPVFLAEETSTDNWKSRLSELLQLFTAKMQRVEETFRADLLAQVPASDLRNWLRGDFAGRLGIYDYASWNTSRLAERNAGMARPIELIGELVWEAITESPDLFKTFLDTETRRVSFEEGAGSTWGTGMLDPTDLFGRNIFPGAPLMSMFQFMFTRPWFSPQVGPSLFNDAAHFEEAAATAAVDVWDAANPPTSGPITDLDLRLLNYTELLFVMHESGAILLGTTLSGEELREQLTARVDEMAALARSTLTAVQLWQEDNYRDLATALAGDLPADPSAWDGQVENILVNAAGEAAGWAGTEYGPAVLQYVGLLGKSALQASAAGAVAGTAVEPGLGTVIGIVVGFTVSTLPGALGVYRGNWAGMLAAVAQSQRVQALSDALIEEVRSATADANTSLDLTLVRLEATIADPDVPDEELTSIYEAMVGDLEAFATVPEGFGDNLTLANDHIYLWVVERGWGLTEPAGGWRSYKPEGGWGGEPSYFEIGPDGGVHSQTNVAVFASLRERVLVWLASNNPTLFLQQVEFEWRSLGLDCETVLDAIRTGVGTTDAINFALFNQYRATFTGLKVPDPISPPTTFHSDGLPAGATFTWRQKLTEYAQALPDHGVFEPATEDLTDATQLTAAGIAAIASGDFTLTATLDLTQSLGSCRLRSVRYEFTWTHANYATVQQAVPGEPDDWVTSIEWVPSNYYRWTVTVATPDFGDGE